MAARFASAVLALGALHCTILPLGVSADDDGRRRSRRREKLRDMLGSIPEKYGGGEHVNLQASGAPKCGGIDPETRDFLGGHLHNEKCGQLISTNCSLTYSPMHCPERCPFFVPSHAFACLFACVRPEDCGDANPDRPFADTPSGTCKACNVTGCKYCKTDPYTCAKCHDKFILEGGGKACTFWMDKTRIFRKIGLGLLCIIGALIPFGVCWFCCYGPHPQKDPNLHAIMRARRHRHLTKTMRWEMTHQKSVASHHDISINLHSKNVLGVGLALLYNSVVFTFVLAFLLWLVTKLVYVLSDAEVLEAGFDTDPAQLLRRGKAVDTGSPVVVVSRLGVCEGIEHLRGTMKNFAFINFVAMVVLYFAFLALLTAFARFQKWHALRFDEGNSSMADFAIKISGLPTDVTDEPELRSWLEEEFRRLLPAKYKRPDEVIDCGMQGDRKTKREATQIEVFGVSVCYDYNADWGDIDHLLQSMQTRQEVECARDAELAGFERSIHHEISVAKVTQQREDHHKLAQQYFNGPKKLHSNGEAYVVFKWSDDMHTVWDARQQFHDLPLCYRHQGHKITLQWVHVEPTSVNWWYLGVPLRWRKVASGFAYIAFLIAVVVLAVILPYYKLILRPYGDTGASASGAASSFFGVLIGNLNGLVGIQIWMTCFGVGFHQRESMDVMVLFSNVLLQFFNIGFTVMAMYLQAYHTEADADGLRDMFSVYRMVSVGIENTFAEGLYAMMMPGFFFVGNVTMLVAAFAWPFLFNTLLMKVVYVWAAFPTCILHILKVFIPWSPDDLVFVPHWRAERALEPMEIQIGDYANLIVITSVCCVSLFVVSPNTQFIFKGMMMWAAFYYLFLRMLHLRFCKKCFYTTNFVEVNVQMLWGVPLSMVACAVCQWGFRSEVFCERKECPADGAKLALLLLTFFLSFGLWLLIWLFVVKPFECLKEKEVNNPTYHEVQSELFYGWLTCNPVFCLKCEYFWHDGHGRPVAGKREDRYRNEHPLASGEDPTKVRYYQVGKEYLFVRPTRQHLAFPDKGFPGNSLEFETYFELALNFWGRLTSPSAAKVDPRDPHNERVGLILSRQLEDQQDANQPRGSSRTVSSPRR